MVGSAQLAHLGLLRLLSLLGPTSAIRMRLMARAVITLWASILRSCVALVRSRRNHAIFELALRQELAIYGRPFEAMVDFGRSSFGTLRRHERRFLRTIQ